MALSEFPEEDQQLPETWDEWNKINRPGFDDMDAHSIDAFFAEPHTTPREIAAWAREGAAAQEFDERPPKEQEPELVPASRGEFARRIQQICKQRWRGIVDRHSLRSLYVQLMVQQLHSR